MYRSLGILQVVVPNLVNSIAEECGNATYGCHIAGIVLKVGFVGSLGANTDNCLIVVCIHRTSNTNNHLTIDWID